MWVNTRSWKSPFTQTAEKGRRDKLKPSFLWQGNTTLCSLSGLPSVKPAATTVVCGLNDLLPKVMRLCFLFPLFYGVAALLLWKLPLNLWLSNFVLYWISWPTSHFLAREPMLYQFIGGCVQWALIGVLFDMVFESRRKD
jgi:hypothetical protein